MTRSLARMVGHGRLQPNPKWRTGPEAHRFHEVILVHEGKMRVEILDEAFDALPGDVLHYPAETEHVEISHPDDPVGLSFIAFEDPSLDPDLPIRGRDTTRRVRQLIEWIFEEAAAGPDTSLPERTTPFIRAIAAQLAFGHQRVLPAMVIDVRLYFQNHLARRITLDDLARVAKLSRYHFNRRYRELTGMPPMADLRRTRLEAARHLLLHTGITLDQIAQRVGMNDAFQLSRTFKRQFGVSPSHYRQHQDARKT